MCESGKQAGQQLVAMSSTGHLTSHLFYVTDLPIKMQFLVNTGAEVSAVPRLRAQQRVQCQGSSLQTVNNTTIST